MTAHFTSHPVGVINDIFLPRVLFCLFPILNFSAAIDCKSSFFAGVKWRTIEDGLFAFRICINDKNEHYMANKFLTDLCIKDYKCFVRVHT